MLDRISNDHSEAISQSNIGRISSLGVSNPYNTNDNSLFVDESNSPCCFKSNEWRNIN